MGRNGHWTPLTGQDAIGSPFSLSGHVYPTQYVIHDCPLGETHRVWLTLSNTHNSADIKVLLKVGASADSFAIRIPRESTVNLGPFLLVGHDDAGISIGAVTSPNNVWVTGHAIVQRTQI